MSRPGKDISLPLAELNGGNQDVVNALLPLIYDGLHGMAENQLRRERKDHTLNATALVHEAYLKLVEQSRVTWQNRAHFLGRFRSEVDLSRKKIFEARQDLY